MDGAAERAVLGGLVELAQVGAVELVRLAELVQEPDDLARVADAYEGNFVAITRSIGRPSDSSRSSRRQRNACVSTRSPGYHLNGTVTRSASWSRSRSSSTSVSAKISAPPRANGTCVTRTLEREGVDSFAASFRDCLDSLAKRARDLADPGVA